MTKSDALKPRRQLGLFDATMIVIGGIVGAGIFANPSEAAHRVHTPFLILGVWVLGGLLAMCGRSEEHTSELQSQSNLVCRLLLEKKKSTTRFRQCKLHTNSITS